MEALVWLPLSCVGGEPEAWLSSSFEATDYRECSLMLLLVVHILQASQIGFRFASAQEAAFRALLVEPLAFQDKPVPRFLPVMALWVVIARPNLR